MGVNEWYVSGCKLTPAPARLMEALARPCKNILFEIITMIAPDEYPVYNHKARPGIGRDLSGNLFYNCFSVKLAKETENSYRPFLFSDFIEQYNLYSENSETCKKCIARSQIYQFPVGEYKIDRSAVERKFNYGDANREPYYYCPLIYQSLLASKLSYDVANRYSDKLPASPISAILSGNWDDEYLFEFQKFSPPNQTQVCRILLDLFSDKFISTPAESIFLKLWFLSAFQQMEIARLSGKRVFFEEQDFDWRTSKFFKFIIPVPQVWVFVIPKPPPGADWKEWENKHKKESISQRADFLFTYQGRRYIVEIDDINHYATLSKGTWLASERKYRETLTASRWLIAHDFEVIRFTNNEILELYDPSSGAKPNVDGFTNLLKTVFLEPKEMVFVV